MKRVERTGTSLRRRLPKVDRVRCWGEGSDGIVVFISSLLVSSADRERMYYSDEENETRPQKR